LIKEIKGMRLKGLYTILFLCSVVFLNAQPVQIIDNRGEVGVFGGMSGYQGDVSPSLDFNNNYFNYRYNFGGFYKKQLNNYAGIRFNYQYYGLEYADVVSKNPYAFQRNWLFIKQFHEFSIMPELYFDKFITRKKGYKWTSYFDFGFSYLVSHDHPRREQYLAFPLILGFKYNFYKNFNALAEFHYSFTNTDMIDGYEDNKLYPQNHWNTYANYPFNPNTAYVSNIFQGSKAGNDALFSAKLGLSYTISSIYGPEPERRKKLKSTIHFKDEEEPKNRKRNLLLFWRK
jgi:hypothetical protein